MNTRIADRPATADELLRMPDKAFGDIRVLAEGDVLDGGDVVPGWTLPVKGLFP